jgi:hypothetical protein
MQPSQTGTTQVASTPPWLTLWKDGAAAIASTLTAVGLLAGGLYSLWVYRNRFPRAKVSHQALHWAAGTRRMVRGIVRVENIGNVMIRVRCIRAVLTQVLPLPPDVATAVNERYDPVERGSTEVVWDTLGDRMKDFSKDGCEIEPGETEEFMFDFVIDADVTKVQFYSHIENVKKFKRNVGWNTTLIHNLEANAETEFVKQDRSGSTEAG